MRALLVVSTVLLGLAGCSAEDPPATRTGLEVVDLRVGDASLRVEVADTPASREAGLRGRAGVPPGTGMVFRFEAARQVDFTMSGVTYPLVAVFVRDGAVVDVAQMVPCAGNVADCPLYGPETEVDTVVEAAPESLPEVRAGDVVS